MRDIGQIIREVDSTMVMEGMSLTNRDKEDIHSFLRGEISFNEMKKMII